MRLRRCVCFHLPVKGSPSHRRPREESRVEESPGRGRAQGHEACPLCLMSSRRHLCHEDKELIASSPLLLLRPCSGEGCVLPTSERCMCKSTHPGASLLARNMMRSVFQWPVPWAVHFTGVSQFFPLLAVGRDGQRGLASSVPLHSGRSRCAKTPGESALLNSSLEDGLWLISKRFLAPSPCWEHKGTCL